MTWSALCAPFHFGYRNSKQYIDYSFTSMACKTAVCEPRNDEYVNLLAGFAVCVSFAGDGEGHTTFTSTCICTPDDMRGI